MKWYWWLLTIIVIIIATYFILIRVAPNAIPTDTPLLGKLACPYPVKISGDSMFPTFTSGESVTFDRCFGDRLDLTAGTIIAFQEGGSIRISRIIEKTNNNPVIYKTAQDAKPDIIMHVSADDIVATYRK